MWKYLTKSAVAQLGERVMNKNLMIQLGFMGLPELRVHIDVHCSVSYCTCYTLPWNVQKHMYAHSYNQPLTLY